MGSNTGSSCASTGAGSGAGATCGASGVSGHSCSTGAVGAGSTNRSASGTYGANVAGAGVDRHDLDDLDDRLGCDLGDRCDLDDRLGCDLDDRCDLGDRLGRDFDDRCDLGDRLGRDFDDWCDFDGRLGNGHQRRCRGLVRRAQPVVDAGGVMTQREDFGHADGLVGDRLEQRLGGHLDGQLDGVTIDARLTLEQSCKRSGVADADCAVLQLCGRDGPAVHEACAHRSVALTFSEVHPTVDREESDSGIEPHRRLSGEPLVPSNATKPQMGSLPLYELSWLRIIERPSRSESFGGMFRPNRWTP
jgi:hypothetical protein